MNLQQAPAPSPVTRNRFETGTSRVRAEEAGYQMVARLITMVHKRRDEILRFGFMSLVAGRLATFISACVVGVLL